MEEIYNASFKALKDYLGLEKHETLLIVTDIQNREIGQYFLEAAKSLCKEAFIAEMFPREMNGQEPPAQISELMKMVDVVVCPTQKSLTHTKARRDAAEKGVRVATMPGITKDAFIRCLNADAAEIQNLTSFIADKMKGIQNIIVKTNSGTDLTMPVAGRKILESTGILRQKGQWGNLPSGEVYLAPVEGKSFGKVIIDGSFAGIGMLQQPIEIIVKDGYAVEIKGGKDAESLKSMLDNAGKEGRAVAEFGIGTNNKAILTGHILEDEKVFGTIHIAFGNNMSMGGSIDVNIHLDGLVKSPDVYFDSELIMKSGKLLNYTA